MFTPEPLLLKGDVSDRAICIHEHFAANTAGYSANGLHDGDYRYPLAALQCGLDLLVNGCRTHLVI